ncbi:hypothetical protein C5612_30420 [Pseudomonas frederiksbergensis]|uniref:Uncharacterized protein n=1 Tax=Pseudomonas frederiksbergensis TaxID=104087 RepID=A0A2S8H4K2_9PSED|nr:hypothetical protein C5612_30420 [Pseudomonas frederiksbergensis]
MDGATGFKAVCSLKKVSTLRYGAQNHSLIKLQNVLVADDHLQGEQDDDNAKEKYMSLAMTIFSMFAAWMAVAIAMLWGVLRIARRHQPQTIQRTAEDVSWQRHSSMPRANI